MGTIGRWQLLHSSRPASRAFCAGVAVLTLGVGAIIAFSKSKKHYIGITWDDGGKKGGVALQADKNEYRGILTALEGVTGRKAVDTDEDAAKKNK